MVVRAAWLALPPAGTTPEMRCAPSPGGAGGIDDARAIGGRRSRWNGTVGGENGVVSSSSPYDGARGRIGSTANARRPSLGVVRFSVGDVSSSGSDGRYVGR